MLSFYIYFESELQTRVKVQYGIGYKSCGTFVSATDTVNERGYFVCTIALLVCGLWFGPCELWNEVRDLRLLLYNL